MIRAALISLALATPAGAFQLGFPLACDLGKTCYIQQFVDHDLSPGARDFTCGGLSYDGHDGTDIALPTRSAMAAGVNVLAAAPGRIKSLRDGITDFAPVIAGKECGNGVLISHDDGWETQYCHLKQGSVIGKPGDAVSEGTVLGQVGQSGLAQFPHLHITLRHNGVEVDPFAPDAAETCGPPGKSLWDTPVPYQPGGILGAGFAPAIPDYNDIKAGLDTTSLPANAPALVLWVYLFGAQAADAILFEIQGPKGRILTERTVIERPQALAFRATGRRLKAEGWPAGRYLGTARLMRGATEVSRIETEVEIR
jgi:hypothetical protein